MRTFIIGILAILPVINAGCENNSLTTGNTNDTDSLTLICPGDTVIPINCPADPDSLGLYPWAVGGCMAQPFLDYTDSFITGGIRRTWVAEDTCGHADTCLQKIGQGAPGSCD